MKRIRELIWKRRDEEEQRRLGVEEAKLQTLVAAVHAAAGNKRGMQQAGSIRLTRRDPVAEMPKFEQVSRMFPVTGEGLIETSHLFGDGSDG